MKDDLEKDSPDALALFPFEKPYPQQVALMDAILQTLQLVDNNNELKSKANVMMLESPTGTGKSLSLACASLAWLKYRERIDMKQSEDEEQYEGKIGSTCVSENSRNPDWLDSWIPPDQVQNQKLQVIASNLCKNRADDARKALENELNSIRTRIRHKLTSENKKDHEAIRAVRMRLVGLSIAGLKNVDHRQYTSKRLISNNKRSRESFEDVEKDFCLDHYASEDNDFDEQTCNLSSSDDETNDETSDAVKESIRGRSSKQLSYREILDGGQLDGSGVSNRRRLSQEKNTESLGCVKPGSGVRKIVYAARTHSQLSQFVGEIRRTKYGETVRVISLGGRKHLCGNTDVNGPSNNRSESLITEACLDLQKGGSSVKPCSLLNKRNIPTLSMHMLAEPSDIEDLAALGRSSKTCAYYGVREALMAAEVVVLPYNTLLSKSTRDSIGLSLKQALVIVDEAHNLPEALRSLSSCNLTLPSIDGALSQLIRYVSKYSSRLLGKNLFYLGQLRRFLTSSQKFLKTPLEGGKEKIMVTATELLFTLKLDNINVYKMLRYLERSKLSQKLHGFTTVRISDNATPNKDDPNFISKHISCMSIVETFLKCLTSSETEGRVVIELASSDTDDSDIRCYDKMARFRYLLLDPSIQFSNVLDEAHSIILAGGTLQPFNHMVQELFRSDNDLMTSSTKITDSFSNYCRDDIKYTINTQLTMFACGHVVSPNNVLLRCVSKGPTGITLDFRHSSRNLSATIDELGETIFEVSKVARNGMVVFFQSYSYEATVIRRWKSTGMQDKINKSKKLFREPKHARDVEATLGMYSKHASTDNGALLLCVVGGKMSEGINFANEMARCVFIAGLPYPDITDPELQEKMRLLDEDRKQKGLTLSGHDYYQNLCLRAINQSIGRAIRHANDYAAIILADMRFAHEKRVWNGLPQWIKKGENEAQVSDFEDHLKACTEWFASMALTRHQR